jgi:uncharacterized lipoprotein YajG
MTRFALNIVAIFVAFLVILTMLFMLAGCPPSRDETTPPTTEEP